MWHLLALYVLAVGIRLLYITSTTPDAPIGSVDAWGYHRLALNIERGNGFSLRRESPYVPDSVRTPLYPGFLLVVRRVFGPKPRTAAMVQAGLDGVTVLAVWWLATALGGCRAGRVAALLYAVSPTQVRYTNELLTETLLCFLLTLCACAVVWYAQETRAPVEMGDVDRGPGRGNWRAGTVWPALAIGLLTGLAVLCKPNVLFLPFIWLLAMLALNRGNWLRTSARAGVMMTAVLCIMSPWILRNRLVFGRWYLSTAFEGNVSRVSAPATLAAVDGEYVPPWSEEWEALFGQIVSRTAALYGWHKPWDQLSARELDAANHQVYTTALQVLRRHPGAWLRSHLLGTGRYLEPQTYRACYARFTGQDWPPDILDDALIHVSRALRHGDWSEASRIVANERWTKLDPLQRAVWWGAFGTQVLGLGLVLLGTWRLRDRPALAVALLLAIACVLWLPGPIAYERFRAPVMGLLTALIGLGACTAPRHVL
jgi:4-amino-4-deoxy-L-arabinose transferase-like glycosyltransferase